MTEISNAMAKLSGIRTALVSALNENVSKNRGKGEIKTRANLLQIKYSTTSHRLLITLKL